MTMMSLLATSVLLILGLLVGACAPAAAPTPAPGPTATTAPPAAAPRAAPSPIPITPAPTLAPAPPTATAVAPAGLQPKYGGILRIAQPAAPSNFDPHQQISVMFLNPVGPAYDGLVQFDPLDPSKIVPDLAESWEVSPDGMAYTFHLFKGVKWHDGQLFTAADVKTSLDRIRQPPKGTAITWRTYLERVKEIQVVDDHTVRLMMDKRDTSLIPRLGVGFMAILARHALDQYGDMKKVVMGTGPYKFAEYVAGTSIRLVRNPDYFVKGRPYLDGITTYIIPDAGARFAAIRTGGIDFIPSYPSLSVSEREVLAKDKSPIVAQTRPGLGLRSTMFNFKRRPWDDARVRRAVSLAVDRQAVVKVAEQGDAVLGAALPPTNWGIPLEKLMQLPGYRYPKEADIAEAKRLLNEAGYPDGFETTLMTRAEPLYERNAVAMQGELGKLRIKAKVQPLERGASEKAQESGNFDVYSGSSSLRLDDPSDLGLFYVTGGGKNYGFYSNPNIDTLFDQLASTIDVSKQKAIALEMQNILLEDNPLIIHGWANDTVALWPSLKNYQIGGMYTHFRMRDVWLDK